LAPNCNVRPSETVWRSHLPVLRTLLSVKLERQFYVGVDLSDSAPACWGSMDSHGHQPGVAQVGSFHAVGPRFDVLLDACLQRPFGIGRYRPRGDDLVVLCLRAGAVIAGGVSRVLGVRNGAHAFAHRAEAPVLHRLYSKGRGGAGFVRWGWISEVAQDL